MAGSSLRLARSPVAPKMTSVVGWTGRRSRPSTSGFSSVRVAIPLLRVRLDLGRGVVRLYRVAAELVAQSGIDLGGEVAHAPRGEALVQRGRDDRRGHPPLDRVLDRPAALARVLDIGLEPAEVVALLLERPRGELAQPRADHRALHPEVRDLSVVELVLAGVEEGEPFGVGLHDPVLHPVVDHLHVVPGTARPEVPPARPVLVRGRRGEHVEDRGQAVYRLVGAPDHHAVADLEAPHAARGAHVHVVDPLRLEGLRTPLVVCPAGVAAVDDRVAPLEQLAELVDGLLGGLAGGDHDPHGARRIELPDQLLERAGARGAAALGPAHRLLAEVERDDLMIRVAVDAMDHVAAHLPQSDEAQLHRGVPLLRAERPGSTTCQAFCRAAPVGRNPPTRERAALAGGRDATGRSRLAGAGRVTTGVTGGAAPQPRTRAWRRPPGASTAEPAAPPRPATARARPGTLVPSPRGRGRRRH